MIKAVLFDLFETLVTERDLTKPRAGALGAALGVDAAAFRRAWRRRRPHVLTGEQSFRGAVAESAAAAAGTVDPAVLTRVLAERAAAKRTIFEQVDPRVLAMVGELRSRGVALGVVSNVFGEDAEGWAESLIAPHFASAVFSCEAGIAKPDPRIYLQALQPLAVAPGEALFVGDTLDELAGARYAGLHAAHAAWFIQRRSDTTHDFAVLRQPDELLTLIADHR